MTTATLGGPLYAAPPLTETHVRFALLLKTRLLARHALDRLLSAPRSAAGFITKHLHFTFLQDSVIARGAGWLLGRLAPAGRIVKSIGVFPLTLAVLASPAVQRAATVAAQKLVRLASRAGSAVGRGLCGFLSVFGGGGERVAQRVQSVAHRALQAVRSTAASWAPRMYVGLAATAVALEVSRPLIRGVLMHRMLNQTVRSRGLRRVLQVLVIPALVDGRLGQRLRSLALRITGTARRVADANAVLLVVEPDGAPASSPSREADTSTEAPLTEDAPTPHNRAERREAQRQQGRKRSA